MYKVPELTEYVQKLPKVKKYKKDGWGIFDIDILSETIGLDKYMKIRVTGGELKEKRKIKRIKLNKAELRYIEDAIKEITLLKYTKGYIPKVINLNESELKKIYRIS
ncbi:hypothetical protein SAMN04244560_02273 [Thermoanaerobacter thermohydrosulfuricus]|uniref:Uncharacterized protein n=1 Tax=Thermoanaerobacter thermohydrosulfuricus TaxID=1516 RepID=A0A1G7TU83_THETY|nr:hypothetical protein [Thermoanaerobacter thermohydrosulfuricus]SDG38916.1 hypothetical protein SAMN04244560_02273 [Thermoanaerobacter thermohydrosulfuricus]